MAEPTEERIINACKVRLRDQVPPAQGHLVSGVFFGIYEFPASNTDANPKPGEIYLVNKEDRLIVVKGQGSGDKGRIECPNARGATFWISQTNDRDAIIQIARGTLHLKHHGLLKTYFTVYNPQLQKMVSACGSASKTLQSWLADISKHTDTYFSDEQKELLMTLYDCVEYIWEKGFTSDALSEMDSYRMIDNRIKLRTLVLRTKTPQDNFLALKNDLATLLTNFVPKWPGVEFTDFISFLRAPYSRTDTIHGHPILCPPKIRQCMYRQFDVRYMSTDQILELQASVPIDPYWTRKITETQYFVLDSLFISNCIESNDVDQALLLAHYASAHYVQTLKRLKPGIWQEFLDGDTVDKYLKECMPGVITKVYALKKDPEFIALED